ncbi:MAG: response regulator [Ignavibacteriaceae bacterium]|nr:response regulator [Ignavibacteriaceae bacterium]
MENQKIQVLLVEDSQMAAKLISLQLKEGMPADSYELIFTDSLMKAFEELKKVKIDITLLDLGLPESQGLDTFKTFFAEYPYLPVIVLTGNEDKTLALKAVREGAQDYLVKGEVFSSLLARSIFYALERGRLQYEKMLNQEKLKKYSEELEVLNATKDKFFSIIAHDLKSPFTVLLGITDILKEDFETMDKDDVKSFIESLNDAAKNQFKLLENLLAWAQMQRGSIVFNPVKIKLYKVCEEVFKLYREHAEKKNIALINKVDPESELIVDTNMIYLLTRNLIYNAIKFTNQGGFIEFGENKIDGFREIYVKDNGVGISPERLAKLFRIEKQNTTSGTAAEKGTGLGLLLCKEMVEKNGGILRVDSVEGEGTTFYFTIME